MGISTGAKAMTRGAFCLHGRSHGMYIIVRSVGSTWSVVASSLLPCGTRCVLI